MRPVTYWTASVAALSLVLLAAGCASATQVAEEASGGPSHYDEEGIVTNVVDGDTIDVDVGGRTYRVRYIGMDAPETVHPTRGEEPYGREAAERNRQLVLGHKVYLEKDGSETDQFGRLRRWVWLDDRKTVNGTLVREGFAVADSPPGGTYGVNLRQYELEAAREERGLWGLEASETRSLAGCDPAYPDVCIAPPPPDLDCAEVPYRRFTVLAPDPHRFDGDRDGVGCES